MQTLQINNLFYKYPYSSISVFENINLEFHKEWTAIVGSNGSGKSTLLKLISKELKSEETTIKGNDLVHYCPQSTEKEPKYIKEYMMTHTSKAFKTRDMLGIKDSYVSKWSELSHGERKRLQIALALFSESDVLMVDEPTNHLDVKSKEIVKQALKNFKGIGILVSHDRELLDELSKTTMMIKDSKITTYRLKFSLAVDEYKKSTLHLQKMQDLHEEKLKKLDRVIQSQRDKVILSKGRVSKRNLDSNDSDSRAKINLAKLTGKDKNDGQMLKRTQAKRKQLLNESIVLNKQSKIGISFDIEKSKKSFPIIIEPYVLEVSEKQKLSFPRLSIEEYDKISIVGDNASGKSSFINFILAQIRLNDTVLYIPQEITEDESKRVFKELKDMPKDKKGELYTLIKRLSGEPKQLIQSSLPSPGEVRKLLIAKGLLSKPSLIILDEPTNHMDLESIEALESALQDYFGTLIIISHDKFFVDGLSTVVWSFEQVEEGFFEIKP